MATRPKQRNSVARFARSMEVVLKQNDRKGGWSNLSKNSMFNSLTSEVFELHEAIIKGQLGPEITKECCDIANYAMMIADRYGCELRAK